MRLTKAGAFKFTEWVGRHYIRLGTVWCHRFSDARDERNWQTTEELYDKFLERMDKPVN